MPPTVKDKDTLVAANNAARPAAASLPPADAGIKQQPVALEVAVTVNGARALDGSDKREPFSESTKTVLVFGNGAVIRLSSAVAPGQLLFLTNEKTKKEVICQVVKSKNYRNVSGYVELEFTEPVVGFWGMRFPGDRVVSAPPPAPAAPQPPPPKVEAPAAIVTPKISETKPAIPAAIKKDSEAKIPEPRLVAPSAPRIAPPAALAPVVQKPTVPATPAAPVAPTPANPEVPVNAAPDNSIEPSFPIVDPSRGADAKAFIIAAQPETPPLLSTLDETNSPAVSETKPAAPVVANAAQSPVSTDPETEALKQHTARLQEELSSLLFSEAAPPAKPVQSAPASPVVKKRTPAEPAAEVLQFADTPEPGPVWAKPAEHTKIAAPSQKSSLDDEELKIPAWLEPLARNAAAPASTEEPVEKEKTKRIAEQPKIVEIATEPLAGESKEIVVELPAPSFGSELPLDRGDRSTGSVSRSSSKGRLVGAIAATVLLLAGGGWWYMRQQSSSVQTNEALALTPPSPAVSVPAATLPSQPQRNAALPTNPSAPVNRAAQNNSPVQTNTVAQKNPAAKPAAIAPASLSTTPARNAQPSSNPATGGTAVATAVSSQPAPTPEPVKKPTLGEVRLAAPKVTRHHNSQNAIDADAGLILNDTEPESNTDALNAGLVDSKQPAAPVVALPVGGDVKQAKLISSVPPTYPVLAKNQHVSGDVRIDALIDANGRVTTMKVVSGPTLLHQAAMDSLRQWKYQPASLDGKPVPMHLTVTLQFRLQ